MVSGGWFLAAATACRTRPPAREPRLAPTKVDRGYLNAKTARNAPLASLRRAEILARLERGDVLERDDVGWAFQGRDGRGIDPVDGRTVASLIRRGALWTDGRKAGMHAELRPPT